MPVAIQHLRHNRTIHCNPAVEQVIATYTSLRHIGRSDASTVTKASDDPTAEFPPSGAFGVAFQNRRNYIDRR